MWQTLATFFRQVFLLKFHQIQIAIFHRSHFTPFLNVLVWSVAKMRKYCIILKNIAKRIRIFSWKVGFDTAANETYKIGNVWQMFRIQFLIQNGYYKFMKPMLCSLPDFVRKFATKFLRTGNEFS